MQIHEFQQMIQQRYLETDAARGTAGTFLWFVEEIGELASALAEEERGTGNRANLEEEFADVMAWLATLANIHGIDLEGALERKYLHDGGPEGTK